MLVVSSMVGDMMKQKIVEGRCEAEKLLEEGWLVKYVFVENTATGVYVSGLSANGTKTRNHTALPPFRCLAVIDGGHRIALVRWRDCRPCLGRFPH